MNKSFKPGVMIDGRVVYPPGWVFVMGFASAGCDWAIEKMSDPEYLEFIERYKEQDEAENLNCEIDRLEKQINQLKVNL